MRIAAIANRLDRSHPIALTLWAMLAAFVTYFCMYAFRKPFTVVKYEGLLIGGLDFKVVLLFAQVGGYALSKLIGIKVISELSPRRRAVMILSLIAVSHLALLLYAVVPFSLKPICLFFNGLPLGMVFGCVFAYLEGRRVTEALAAGLCASFIMASGSVKSVGAMLMEYQQVSPFWMPFVTGALFWVPLLLGVWMLEQLPPPGELDISARSPRTPFNGEERGRFFSRYALGICALVLVMVLLTVFRSIRDDYATEIWSGFGVERPEIFAISETWVAVVAVLLSAITVLIPGNYRAFQVSMGIIAVSFASSFGTTLFWWNTPEWTEATAFLYMVQIGICLYVPYVLFHTTVYERAVALLKEKSNAGYLLYLGDCAGYFCTIFMMILFHLISPESVDFKGLLFRLAVVISPASIALAAVVALYFRKQGSSFPMETIEHPLPETTVPTGVTP